MGAAPASMALVNACFSFPPVCNFRYQCSRSSFRYCLTCQPCSFTSNCYFREKSGQKRCSLSYRFTRDKIFCGLFAKFSDLPCGGTRSGHALLNIRLMMIRSDPVNCLSRSPPWYMVDAAPAAAPSKRSTVVRSGPLKGELPIVSLSAHVGVLADYPQGGWNQSHLRNHHTIRETWL